MKLGQNPDTGEQFLAFGFMLIILITFGTILLIIGNL
jgi:hypothetical protein